MRFIVMFVTAVCVLFLIKLRWPKKKNFYSGDLPPLIFGQKFLIITINCKECICLPISFPFKSDVGSFRSR